MINFDAIPHELIVRNQWVVWKLERTDTGKLTKRPYSAHSGKWAKINEPLHWSSFEHCKSIVMSCPQLIDGIGFCLSKDDPYAFIDLDEAETDEDRQKLAWVYEASKSYAEISPGGGGLHIICKGALPSGRKKKPLEVYSSNRFMTMTGNVYRANPIIDESELLSYLWVNLKPNKDNLLTVCESQPQIQSDYEIFEAAKNAKNGEKFLDLWYGNWEKHDTGEKQSGADFALFNMLGYYSKNKEQIERMFLASALGQREKAKRPEYRKWMIDRVFDRDPPKINIDSIKNQIESTCEENKMSKSKDVAISSHVNKDLPLPPPGLLNDISKFIYDSSARPIPEVALSSAIAIMAGVCGRAYNVEGTGLNLFILLMLRTGRGKSFGVRGVNLLMNQIDNLMEDSNQFIGPGEIASGPAAIKWIAKKSSSFVSFIGEFGERIKQLSHPRASSSEISLSRFFLDIYMKSGKGDYMHASAYSNKENETEKVLSPAVSIYGESNPDTFYQSINESIIEKGLMSRFIVFESLSERKGKNKDAYNVKPTPELIARFRDLIKNCMDLNIQNIPVDVKFTKKAQKIYDEYDKKCDDRINNAENSVSVQNLWTRASLNAVRLAALCAVGNNNYAPMITPDILNWAIEVVELGIIKVSERFKRGDIRSNNVEGVQIDNVIEFISGYISSDYEKVKKSMQCKNARELHNDKIIMWSYLYRKCSNVQVFKTDKLGVNNALKRTIDILIQRGEIVELTRAQMLKYDSSSKAYAVKNLDVFIKQNEI